MIEKPSLSGSIEIKLPDWLYKMIKEDNRTYPTAEERMRFVIKLAKLNVENKTGGPFGAAIFDLDTNRLISAGVNLVVPARCSILHAEMVVISFAQKVIGYYNLGDSNAPRCELVSSTEPCAMCLGAIPWSGVESLVCGTRDKDVRRYGFDEGDKPVGWKRRLIKRGIKVQRDVLRKNALEVIRLYHKNDGEIYNGYIK